MGIEILKLLGKQEKGLVELQSGHGMWLFRERVRQHEGLAYFFMHPFFAEENQAFAQYPHIPEYTQRRDRYLASSIKNQDPLVIFEEYGEKDKLKTRFSPDIPPTLYVPTLEANQTPTYVWRKFLKMLTDAGVKSILLGGQYLVFRNLTSQEQALKEAARKRGAMKANINYPPKWTETNLLPIGCVGTLAFDLAFAGFDVDFIYGVCSPSVTLERTDIRKVRNPLMDLAIAS